MGGDAIDISSQSPAGFGAIARGRAVAMTAPSAPVRRIAGVVARCGEGGVSAVAADISSAADRPRRTRG